MHGCDMGMASVDARAPRLNGLALITVITGG